MPLSPLIVVIGVVFILSVALLLLLALEERFDERATSELEHDVAYQTMLEELREMQGSGTRFRPRPARLTGITSAYETDRGFQGT